MPNKDSFTFSDKLRKSKSVPLSKRLPSIVGGNNTQKRTLVQRAQRDLPFILVAALALLLLPFLSRTGSDDIASTENIAWNTLTDAPSFAEGGGADIMPAGTMKDPLDWIIGARNDVKDSDISAGDSAKSAYGSESSSTSRSSRYGTGTGSDDGSSYGRSGYSSYSSSSKTKKPAAKSDYNTNKSYDESYITKKTTKKPATAKYGQKTRAGVRKSFERKATDINRALRISQMPGQRGAANVSHNLPIGQGPNRGSASNPREGIRPVALQPMEAKGGIGRSMTGENLYAEAARSIREMNAGGPAKQNLLAAQMRDVGGKLTPEGLGGPGAGASVRPGAGGNGPGNNNGYNIGKPWWWDMMRARSQKMWDLLYYKPREIFWNNIYNYLSQLMNCLATGNKDGDVSTMFGKGGSSDSWVCKDENGNVIRDVGESKKFVAVNATTTKSGTKDGDNETTADKATAFGEWAKICALYNGKPALKQSSDTGFWGVRAECVGLDVLIDRMKGWIKKEYNTDCDTVTVDGIHRYTVWAKRKGIFQSEAEYNSRLSRKAVIALIAQPTKLKGKQYDGNEYVVALMHQQEFSATTEELEAVLGKDSNCELTKIVSFISRDLNSNVEYEVQKRNNENYSALIDLTDKVPFSIEYCRNGEKKNRALTYQELKRSLHPKKNSVNQCPIPSPEQFAKEMKLNGEDCFNYPDVSISIDNRATAEAFIKDPAGKYVFAVAVEQLTSMTDPEIRHIESYGLISRENTKQIKQTDPDNVANVLKYEYDDAKQAYHFYFQTNLAVEGFNKEYTVPTTSGQSEAAKTDGSTVRGDGRIFWIVTSQPTLEPGIATGTPAQFKGKSLNQLRPTDFAKDSGTTAICHYRWCDDVDSCSTTPRRPSPTDYCVEDGEAYLAQKVTFNGKEILVKVPELDSVRGISIDPNWKECVMLCHGPDGVHICDKNNIPDENEPPCPLQDLNPQIPTPQCHGCCTYTTTDGKTNNYESIEVDGKHYIIDARPSKCQNTKNNQCTPAAWSKENDKLFVYDMSEYNPNCLKFIPGESAEPFRTCTGTGSDDCPQVTLTKLDSEPFTLIHDQSYQMDPNLDPNKPGIRPYDPHYFELFPQLTLLKDIEVDLSACYFCGKSLYDNADVRAKAEVISEIDGRLRECFERIKELEAMGATESVKQLKTIYFYGYASKRGSHDAYELPGKGGKGKYNVGCITSGANVGFNDDDDIRWGYCNKSLSQDRSLYIMYKLLTEKQLARDYDIGVDEESTRIFENLRGFTNTLPKKGDVISYTGTKPSYRLNKKYYPKGDGEEYTFISKPCGSDGAAEVWNADLDVQKKDRLVLIAPIGSPDYNGCFPKRMTCGDENADVEKALAKIAEDIKAEIKSKRRSVSVANRTAPIPSIMNFVTESDENFITNEEMAEIQNYGKNGPLSNGELAINDEDYGGRIKTTAVHNRNNSEEEITPEQQALLDAYNDVSGLNF